MTADMINHPPHYTRHPSGVECITITRHMGFNLGNAVKYIWRADTKGAALDDLRKAAWYIADEIAKREAARTLPREGLPFEAVKAERDAARAMDMDPQPLEWPQTHETAPPDGHLASGLCGVAAKDATACQAQNQGGQRMTDTINIETEDGVARVLWSFDANGNKCDHEGAKACVAVGPDGRMMLINVGDLVSIQ